MTTHEYARFNDLSHLPGLNKEDALQKTEDQESALEQSLELLRTRFTMAQQNYHNGKPPSEIYTRAGLTIIAVNPFTGRGDKLTQQLYTPAKQQEYAEKRGLLEPHLYEISAAAYEEIQRENGRSQAILINGESGSGKTEAVKIMLGFFTGRVKDSAGTGGAISHMLLKSSDALEAWGNARTIRNNNSSRFGKYILLHFSPSEPSKLAYASIQHYLLEMPRVVEQSDGEQPYHAFNFLLKGRLQAGRNGESVSSAKVTWGQLVEKGSGKVTDMTMSSFVIGSAPCDLTVNLKGVSKQHCKISLCQCDDGTDVVIEDTSTNGTMVNDQKMRKGNRVNLTNGDTISLASQNMWITFKFLDHRKGLSKATLDSIFPASLDATTVTVPAAADAQPPKVDMFGLDEHDPFKYKYVRSPHQQSSHGFAEGYKDADDSLRDMLMQVGVEVSVAEDYWRQTAGILHLGEVQFITHDERWQGDEPHAQIDPSSRPSLSKACELLQLDELAVADSLVSFTHNFKNVEQKRPRTKQQAEQARDSLAKGVYKDLFSSLVQLVNRALRPARSSDLAKSLAVSTINSHSLDLASSARSVQCSAATIGLLDIFGAEVFQRNSLAQLLINYANDKLQLYFTDIVVKAKANTFRSELDQELGIDTQQERLLASLAMIEGEAEDKDFHSLFGALEDFQKLNTNWNQMSKAVGNQTPDQKYRTDVYERCKKLEGFVSGNCKAWASDIQPYSTWKPAKEGDKECPSLSEMQLQANPLAWISQGSSPPKEGSEIVDEELLAQLIEKRDIASSHGSAACLTFAPEEWASLGITTPILSSSYIKVEHAFYRPRSKYQKGDWTTQRVATTGSWVSVADAPKGTHDFGVNHFGGPVFYSVDNFVALNFDKMDVKLTSLLDSRPWATRSESKDRVGICRKFTQSMHRLNEMLRAADGHFVRCIKPTDKQDPDCFFFEDGPTKKQLKSCGVVYAAKVAQGMYQIIAINDFLGFQPPLGFAIPGDLPASLAGMSTNEMVSVARKILVEKYGIKEFEKMPKAASADASSAHFIMGKTKLFLQSSILDVLHATRRERWAKLQQEKGDDFVQAARARDTKLTEDLKKQLQVLRTENQDMTAAAAKAAHALESAQTELLEEKGKQNALEQAVRKGDQTILELKQQMAEFVQKAQAQAKEKDRRLHEAEECRQELFSQLNATKAELATAKESARSNRAIAEAESEKAAAKMNALEEELAKEKQDLKTTSMKLSTAEEQAGHLNSEVRSLRSSLEAAKTDISEAGEAAKKVAREADEKAREVEAQHVAQEQSYRNERAALAEEIQTLKRRAHGLGGELKAMEISRDALVGEIEEKRKDINEKQKEIDSKEVAIADVTGQLDETRNHLYQREAACNLLQQQLEEEKTNHSNTRTELSDGLEVLKDQLKQRDGGLAALRLELLQMKGVLDFTSTELTDEREHCAQLQDTINHLQSAVEAHSSEVVKLKEQIMRMHVDYEAALAAQDTEHTQTVNTMQSRMDSMEDSMRDDVNTLEIALAEAEDEKSTILLNSLRLFAADMIETIKRYRKARTDNSLARRSYRWVTGSAASEEMSDKEKAKFLKKCQELNDQWRKKASELEIQALVCLSDVPPALMDFGAENLRSSSFESVITQYRHDYDIHQQHEIALVEEARKACAKLEAESGQQLSDNAAKAQMQRARMLRIASKLFHEMAFSLLGEADAYLEMIKQQRRLGFVEKALCECGELRRANARAAGEGDDCGHLDVRIKLTNSNATELDQLETVLTEDVKKMFKQGEVELGLSMLPGTKVTPPPTQNGDEFLVFSEISKNSAQSLGVKKQGPHYIVDLRSSELERFRRLFATQRIRVQQKGLLTPMQDIDHVRAGDANFSGVPEQAKWFAWAFPLAGVENLPHEMLDTLLAQATPEECFVVRGGFLFFDKKDELIRIHTECGNSGNTITLNLSIPTEAKDEQTKAMLATWQTQWSLRQKGITAYSWIAPFRDQQQQMCAGAFVYLYQAPYESSVGYYKCIKQLFA